MNQRKQRSDKGIRRKRAHEPNGTFTADNPATPQNEAYEPQVSVSRGFQAEDGLAAAYRDGPNGTVETTDFADGWIPEGWHDTPAKCDNCDGTKHLDYVKVKL